MALKSGMARIMINLKEEDKRRIEILAHKEDRSVSNFLLRIIMKEIEELEKEGK